ncbi:MAG: hypothetical protein AAGC78_10265 [Cellvibrio sp.]|uniref:hypothetical protein n=1 Tax=Cellvibrio sp. TaxID=1965322 RepID=UPI0031B128B0
MIARKRLHMIVIALCLWLPLQAIAGQWLHCAQIESSLAQLDSAAEPKPHPSCHDSVPDAQFDSSTTSNHHPISTDTKSCNHCQFSCSWHSALVVHELTPMGIYSESTYIQFKVSSPAQPALETPQRPPQFCA